jgi:hypothetical protein
MPYHTQIFAAVSMFQMASEVVKVRFHIGRSTVHMDPEQANQVVEIRLTYRYIKAHPWTVQAISGFLSAYFMEKPGFAVQRHFDDLESGMHVWVCEVPANMKIPLLLRRLQTDIPPCRHVPPPEQAHRPQYVIDSPE